MEIENSKPVSQKNVVYDLSFLNELMQSDKKPSRTTAMTAVQQIPETKPKSVPEKVNPPAKKKKIKTESGKIYSPSEQISD